MACTSCTEEKSPSIPLFGWFKSEERCLQAIKSYEFACMEKFVVFRNRKYGKCFMFSLISDVTR